MPEIETPILSITFWYGKFKINKSNGTYEYTEPHELMSKIEKALQPFFQIYNSIRNNGDEIK